jgi:NADPH-dependent 2,4-dienoyl-CoA reductase/sulfur reductase-like enzyme/rhodanese-related sulfurtransferase
MMIDRKMKVVIIGGVAGGAAAAARIRRLCEDCTIIVFEKGNYVSFANCGLPYHIGGHIKKREDLFIHSPESLKSRFNLDVRTNSEVVAINRDRKSVSVEGPDGTYEESYDKLLIATGAEALRPPIAGIDSDKILTLRNPDDMDAIIGALGPAGSALVVGGGYIGLELLENLRQKGLEVTLVEALDQVMPTIDKEMAQYLNRVLSKNGAKLKLSCKVIKFHEHQDGIGAQLDTGEVIVADFVILAIGIRPANTLARDAGLELGVRGTIKTDSRMRTSDPDIFAVGDVAEIEHVVSKQRTNIPLAGPAARQARVAADNILGRNSTYKGGQGTAILKLFELTVASTGLAEKDLLSIEYGKVYLHPHNHVTYYPGASSMAMKVLFTKPEGKLLGAQIIGKEGVDRRIDVLATAVRAGLTVFELQDLELAYAPPYGSAKDSINMVGYIASNLLENDTEFIYADELSDLNPEETIILDVRTPKENRRESIPGSTLIPLSDLRSNIHKLDKDKEIVAFCLVGVRAYMAERMLKQNGYRCRNLSGGILSWKASQDS